MSVISQYFTRAREASKRRAEWEKKMIEESENPKPVVEEIYNCAEEFSEFDTLLRRNWFIDDEHIIDLVWDATDEAFNKIMENVHTYPRSIRNVLMNEFNPTNRKMPRNVTLKLKVITDDEMVELERTKQKEINNKFEAEWQSCIKQHGLSRPADIIDEKYTDLYEKLQAIKKQMEEEVKKPSSKKYVPVQMRGTSSNINPEVEKLQTKIKDLENEIVKTKKEIEQQERIWENGKKANFTNEILNKVFNL